VIDQPRIIATDVFQGVGEEGQTVVREDGGAWVVRGPRPKMDCTPPPTSLAIQFELVQSMQRIAADTRRAISNHRERGPRGNQ
jgi:hypothetical protein